MADKLLHMHKGIATVRSTIGGKTREAKGIAINRLISSILLPSVASNALILLLVKFNSGFEAATADYNAVLKVSLDEMMPDESCS